MRNISPVCPIGFRRIKFLNLHAPIKTSRLTLKQQSLNDFERFFAMSKDPEVMRYIGDGSIFHWTRDVALNKFKEQLSAPETDDAGTWAVYRQADSHYLGWCAVSHSRFLGATELGYRFCRDVWGCGYATEAASGLIERVFTMTDLDQVLACAHPDNAASLRVLQKLGFSYAFSKHSNPVDKEIPVYQLDRNAWGSTRSTPG
jgi:RimJ/RimL family protein N-acetyltransferase